MHDILPFQFDQHAIRVQIDERGEPWFVAADVCAALDHSNVTQALKRLDDDEQALISSEGIHRGSDQVNAVNESGLYNLILGSRKPEAKRFKRWVIHEVLPSIRKTGSYAIQPLASSPAELLVMLAQQHLANERRVAAIEDKVKLIEAKLPQEQDYFTVIGYGRFTGERVSNNMAIALGRRAARISRARGIPVGDTTDPRYGFVHTYHLDVLQEAFQ